MVNPGLKILAVILEEMMRKRFMQFHLITLIGWVTFAGIGMTVYQSLDGPSIIVTPSKIDIGVVRTGMSGTCRFVVENRGSEPIRIRPGAGG